MFIHVHCFSLAGRISTENFRKETDDTVKILPLVYGIGLYKSFDDKQDSVLAWIPNERHLHAFLIVFLYYFQETVHLINIFKINSRISSKKVRFFLT